MKRRTKNRLKNLAIDLASLILAPMYGLYLAITKGDKQFAVFIGKIMALLFRAICSPFLLILLVIAAARLVLIGMLDYIIYGGEMVIYNEALNKNTIAGILNEKGKC